MRSSRYFLIMGGAIFGLLFLALICVSTALFHSVDQSGATISGGIRLAPIMANIQDQMRLAKSAEDVKRNFKSFESITGLGAESEQVEKLQKVYSTLVSHFANKPREAEQHHLLIKKRDFLEIALNNYRKEIPRGDIRIRALLLNVIFDTQSSFLNESAEMEQVYLKHTHERVSSLKALAAHDGGVLARAANLESAIALYEKSFLMSESWNSQREEILIKADKSVAQLLQDLKRSADGGIESSRRSFFYTGLFSAIISIFCLGLLLVGYKVVDSNFKKRSNLLFRYLRQFGQEKRDLLSVGEMETLRSDEGWQDLLFAAQEAEEKFVQNYQTQISVAKSMQLPFFVLKKDRSVLFWNKSAADLFQLPEKKDGLSLDDLISTAKISPHLGDSDDLVDVVRNSFAAPKDDVFEFHVKTDKELVPVELNSSPITSGPLVGGKIYVLRQIRNEASRVERAVSYQLNYARDLVHKMTHGYDFEIEANESYSPPVRALLGDFQSMKLKVSEREALWKSEGLGLLDQIERQREILLRLGREIQTMRDRHDELTSLFAKIYEHEETLTDEMIVVERDLAVWSENRKRLKSDLESQAAVLRKARAYEDALREAVTTIKVMIGEIRNDLADLQRFREEARVNAINLSFAENASPSELSAKARAYANQLGNFCDRVRKISDGLESLVHAHPAAALLPQLDAMDIDSAALGILQDEHTKLGSCLEKWRSTGEEILTGGEKALALLSSVDKMGISASQLGETSAIINEQAKANLARWQ